jgi:hypothetical protein
MTTFANLLITQEWLLHIEITENIDLQPRTITQTPAEYILKFVHPACTCEIRVRQCQEIPNLLEVWPLSDNLLLTTSGMRVNKDRFVYIIKSDKLVAFEPENGVMKIAIRPK